MQGFCLKFSNLSWFALRTLHTKVPARHDDHSTEMHDVVALCKYENQAYSKQ